MTTGTGDSQDREYAKQVEHRAAAVTEAEARSAYSAVLEDVFKLGDVSRVAHHRIWRYELPWPDKDLATPGYLLMAGPEERAAAAPERDFYIYVLPVILELDGTGQFEQDEVLFRIPGLPEELAHMLRLYTAARRLRAESTFSWIRGYQEQEASLGPRLARLVEKHFLAEAVVTYMGDDKPLAALTTIGADRRLRPRDALDQASSVLLAPYLETRFPSHVLVAPSVTPEGEAETGIPFHPWRGVRRRALAQLATQLVSNAPPREAASSGDVPAQCPPQFLDLCSGVATIAEAAAEEGSLATAVDSSPVATLIAKARLDYGRDPLLLKPAGDWAGLHAEVTAVASKVLLDTRRRAGAAWLVDLEAVLMMSVTSCPSCGSDVPATRSIGLGRKHELVVAGDQKCLQYMIDRRSKEWRRTQRSCLFCGVDVPRNLPERRYLPVATRAGSSWAVAPADHTMGGLDLGGETPTPGGNAVFSYRRQRPLTWIALTSSRQRAVINALCSAARDGLDGLKARSLPARAVEAVDAYLALFASSMLTYLSRATRLSSTGQIMPGPAGPDEWASGLVYVEVGGQTIEAAWQRRVSDALVAIGQGGGQQVAVRRGDARHLPFENGTFDAVIWDPPYYDNIDYDGFAAPFEQIIWAVAPGHPDLGSRPATAGGKGFDAAAYRSGFHAMAAEARRVLREGGHLGVWWVSESPSQLQELIDTVAGVGLELRSVIPIDTERALSTTIRNRHRTYLLIFQRTTAPILDDAPQYDAGVVLALATEHLPNLYGALASILEEEYPPEVLEKKIPSSYKGSLRERVAEFVAAAPELDKLLTELGWRPLTGVCQRFGLPTEASWDIRQLAGAILKAIGFLLPVAPVFSVETAVPGLYRVENDVSLARDVGEATGPMERAERIVTGVLKLASLCWARLLAGEEWEKVLKDNVERASTDKKFLGAGRMSLGDWKTTFGALPKQLANAGTSKSSLFELHRRTIKTLKGVETLERFVNLRNAVIHPEGKPVPDVSELTMSVKNTALLFDKLIEAEVLPVVLTPQVERRDRWGRRFLLATDGRGRSRELVVQREIDLSRAVVWIPRLVNPRDVDPILLSGPELDAFLLQSAAP